MCSKIFYFVIFLVLKESSSNKLLGWFNRVKNPAFECPPTDLNNNNFLEVKNILQVVDCETPEARWDYKYKVREFNVTMQC